MKANWKRDMTPLARANLRAWGLREVQCMQTLNLFVGRGEVLVSGARFVGIGQYEYVRRCVCRCVNV